MFFVCDFFEDTMCSRLKKKKNNTKERKEINKAVSVVQERGDNLKNL